MTKRYRHSVKEIDEILERSKLSDKSHQFLKIGSRAAGADGIEAATRVRPHTNRGGSGDTIQPGRGSLEIPRVGRLVLTDAGVRIELPRNGASGEACFIDYASLTFGEGAVRHLIEGCSPFSDQEHADVIGRYARDALLGVNCEVSDMRTGVFGYEAASKIGDYGISAAGGNNSTCYLSFTGQAFAVADEGFSERLHNFVMGIGSAQLTRIDLAFDDPVGNLFLLRKIPARWQAGEFSSPRSPRLPKFEQRGPWLADDPDGSGLTAYIGARASGKLLRIYEKGKQLGDTKSEWVRAEAELRNSVFSLVPDMLIHPSAFFVMLCPAFASIAYMGKPEKLHRQAGEALTSLDAVLDVIKTQYGGYLDVLRKESYFASDTELLDRLSRVPRVVPAALRKINNLTGAALNAGASLPSSSAEILTEGN